MRTLLTLMLVVLLAGCGRTPQGVAEVVIQTREVPPEELRRLGFVHPLVVSETGEDELGLHSQTKGTGAIVNALAGVAQKLLTPGEQELGAVMLGHAIPDGTKPMDLNGGKPVEKTYEKTVKSLLGFTLIKAYYKISYQYGQTHKGKGSYLTNLKFTPLKVETEPPWNLKASSLSEHPINVGTAIKPIASLGFSITFTVYGALGSRAVTDEFSIHAGTGEMKETIRSLDE